MANDPQPEEEELVFDLIVTVRSAKYLVATEAGTELFRALMPNDALCRAHGVKLVGIGTKLVKRNAR